MQYRILPGCEWFSLQKIYKAGEIIELSEAEGKPFLGKILETVEPTPDPVKAKPGKAAKKETYE